MSELVGVFPPSLDQDPLRRALDCLQEGFQIIGYDWHYVYLNPAAARHGRRPAQELIGHSIFEEYPGIDQTAMFGTAATLDGGAGSAGLRDRVHIPGRQHAMVRVAGTTRARRASACTRSDIDQRKRRRAGTSPRDRAPVLVRLWRSILGRAQTRSS